jgi:hypothetical protein
MENSEYRLVASGGSERPRQSRIALVVGVTALLFVYAATATWTSDGQTRDTRGAALPGWNLVENGSLELSEFSSLDAWLVETDDGWFSNRSPGLIAVASVGYLLTAPFTDSFSYWPSTMMAILMSAAAAGLVAATAERLGGEWSHWPIVIVGLASSVWSIAADQLWPHGPAAMFLALGVWGLTTDRNWLVGAVFGLAVLVRPPVAVIAFVIGVGLSLYRRDAKPLFQIGVPTSVAAVAYLFYNWLIFGSLSPTAAYEAVGGGLRSGTDTLQSSLANVLVAFASPRYGVLVWTPWIIVGMVATSRAWKSLPDWARILAPAAIIYLMVHVQINRVSGGLPYNYRYAIEAVVVAAPVLIAGLWTKRGDGLFKTATVITVLTALTLQIAFVFVSECTGIGTATPKCGLFGL